MPPIQPSLRGSLLTGASALAMSISGSGAQAQNASSQISPPVPTQWTVWAEGALFNTVGGSYNIPSIPGLGAPFTSFNPQGGWEAAVGFDYRSASDPAWHFVFDFRYGRSRPATSNSSSSFTTFSTNFTFSPPLVTETTNTSATHATEREGHLVADLMIGRDFNLGGADPQFQFGLRFADLWAAARAEENGSTTTTSFYEGETSTEASDPVTSSAIATWNSHFFGVGPRVAITGGVPIAGSWTFDYEAGVAALFGNRSFDYKLTSSSISAVTDPQYPSPLVVVFNADAWVALSYYLTPYTKVSAGIRTDYYNAALTTYNINTGGLESISRDYWGPFVRLTGSF